MKRDVVMFEGDLDEMSVEEIINKFQICKSNIIDFYFCSNGGFVNNAEILIDYINKSKKHITIIANGMIQSCAFNVLAFTKCKKVILPTCLGMIHYYGVQIEGKKITKKTPLKNRYQEDIIKYGNENAIYDMNRLMEFGVQPELVERAIKGEEVVINNNMMKTLFERR